MPAQLPTLRPRQVMRALERAGFVLNRVRGSHHYYEHPDRPELLVCVPNHPRDLKPPVLRSIIRQAGLTPEEFLRLL
jgi:predicted RNA binding protein YcfA (HicA-like mRNA interferase family)